MEGLVEMLDGSSPDIQQPNNTNAAQRLAHTRRHAGRFQQRNALRVDATQLESGRIPRWPPRRHQPHLNQTLTAAADSSTHHSSGNERQIVSSTIRQQRHQTEGDPESQTEHSYRGHGRFTLPWRTTQPHQRHRRAE